MFFFFEKNNIPTYDMMMKPLLQALRDLGGSASIKQLDAKVIEIMAMSDNIIKIPHEPNSNRSEVSYRLAWARTYLKKAGFIDNVSRGVWQITNKLNGNLNNINITQIVSQIRKDSLKVLNDPNLSGVESGFAFEKHILSNLSEYLKSQKKEIEINNTAANMLYTAYLPQGIDNMNESIYVAIKLRYSKRGILRHLERLAFRKFKYKILFIIGEVLLKKQKKEILDLLYSLYGERIILWDYEDMQERISLDTPYLQNPKKAIIEDAINNIPSQEAKINIKNNLISSLKKSYDKQELTLCLGAGTSFDAGVPIWNELVNTMLINMLYKKSTDRKINKRIILEKLNEIALNNKENSSLTQMRYIKAAFQESEYHELLHKAIYKTNKINTNTCLLNSIIDICTPRRNHFGVKSVITYNFDDLLEQKLKDKKVNYNIIYNEAHIPDDDSLNIYHVHGYLPKNQEKIENDINLVFSEEDYHRIYRDSFSWSNIAQINSFRDNTCLFIGCSLTDPNLRRLLDMASRSKEEPRHYAFLKRKTFILESDIEKEILAIYEDIDTNIRKKDYESIGINIIWVDDYSEIPLILSNLI